MQKIFLVMAVVVGLAACTITQNVESAKLSQGSQLCIIENSKVKAGFLKEYQAVLDDKKIPYQVVSESSVPSSCEWTSTYVARWRWDLALYMEYAEIKVFYKGSLSGQATYDASRGGGSMSKFIDAEPKIRELVDQLIQLDLASIIFGARA